MVMQRNSAAGKTVRAARPGLRGLGGAAEQLVKRGRGFGDLAVLLRASFRRRAVVLTAALESLEVRSFARGSYGAWQVPRT